MANHAWNGEHNWVVGEPITQEKMNSIEGGVATALEQQSQINALDSRLDKIDGGSGFSDSNYQTLAAKVAGIATTAGDAARDALQALEDAEQGKDAWTYVAAVMEFDNGTNEAPTKSLKARLEQDELAINAANTVATIAQTWINDAKVIGGQVWDAANNRFKNADSLAERIGEINRLIEKANTTAESTAQIVTPTNGRSFGDRLTALDANTTPSMTVPAIITEISNARGTNSQGGNNENLSQRFAQDESRLDAIDGNTTPSRTLPDVITEVDNAHRNNGDTLDARFDSIDGGSAPSRTLPNVITEINDAHRSGVANDTLNQRFNAIDSSITAIENNIGSGFDTTNTVAAKITAAENAAKAYTDTKNTDYNVAEINAAHRTLADGTDTLDNRFDDIESAIATLNGGASTSGSVLDVVNSRIAEVVNNAPEAFDTLKEIADWIGENSDDALTMQQNISDNADAIDALDTRLDAIDGGSALTGSTLASRVSTVESDIDTLETAVGDVNSGLIKDVNDLSNAIDHAAGENDAGGLIQRITAAEGRLTTAESAINNAATSASVAVLAGQVAELANKDTIVVSKPNEGSNFTNNIPNISNPLTTADYLIQADDDKYYYWRYFGPAQDQGWQLISGAGGNGGTGNTSGMDLTAAEYAVIVQNETYAENTDYYVTESDGFVHHYRYITVNNELTEIEIGTVIDTDNIKQYNMAIRTVEETEENQTVINNYLYLFDFDYGENNAISDTDADERIANNEYVKKIKLPAGGGGGAAVNTMKITRITPRKFTTANSEASTKLRFFFTTGEAEEQANYSVTVDGVEVISDVAIRGGDPSDKSNSWPTGTIPTGFYEFDVGEWCTDLKEYSVVLTIHLDANDTITATADWTVKVINFAITSDAAEGKIVSVDEAVVIPYVPFGSIDKELHVIIDNDPLTETIVYIPSNASGSPREYVIPANTLAHGPHTIDLQMTAEANGVTIYTDHVVREYIWYDSSVDINPIIIASRYSQYNNQNPLEVDSYSDLSIPYSVYNKNGGSYEVSYYLNYGTNSQSLIGTVELTGNSSGLLEYIPVTTQTQESQTLTIKVSEVTLTIYLTVKAIKQNVSVVPGAIIDFDPTMLTNNSTNREPSWPENNPQYHLRVSDNFNWSDDASGGGYKRDEDGKCFVIKAGSYVDIDYKMFTSNNGESAVFDSGAEMKLIFKVDAVRKADAVWFTNVGTISNKPVGIQLNAHNGWLKTDKASDTTAKDTEEEYPTWSANGEYTVNDSIVVYKNVIYKYIKQCVNYTILNPTDSGMDDYWETVTTANWVSGTEYSAGDVVVSTNGYNLCIKDVPAAAATLDPKDDSNNTYWQIITAWNLGTAYVEGDHVSYNNNVYKCVADVVNWFTTNPKTATKYWLKLGATETEVLATNSYLYFPYSEGDKIELDININQHVLDSNGKSTNDFIMSYEDGVPSKAYAYTYGSDGLYHQENNESIIRIGSEDCDVYIYRLRIYDKSLKTEDILQNFIADGQTVKEKKERYERNCIYWDGYEYSTTASQTAKLDPIKLAEKMPNVKVLMLDTPIFTTGKKDFVKNSSLRCIQVPGGDLYPGTLADDNWFFQNGYHAGQGTTSDNYGQAGRNVDFLFECDGNHAPTKAKNLSKIDGVYEYKGYVSSLLMGNDTSEWVKVDNDNNIYAWRAKEGTTPDECQDWMGDHCKVQLTPTSVPNNYFNLKVNIASSENVNNALFQKRYNEFLPYNSPANVRQRAKHGYSEDIKVKNVMEFVPAVLFVRENDPNISKHNEFQDTNWHFYALGNIGDSKKSDYTRAYDPDDMNEFTVENSDNNTNNGQFQSGVFMYEGHRAVETPYKKWVNNAAFKKNDIVVKDGKIYKRTGENQASLSEGATYTWNAAEWNEETISSTEPMYFASYEVAPNPMDYIYPISSEEWNIKYAGEYLNYRHYTLVTEEFDGDHSFEFRYACRGDYRDGDLVNESDGQDDDAQFDINHDTFLAFYEWLITATEEQYQAEASQWFVPSAMEFFYAYTHYYTMMDNRAKNTFWHFAQTGEYREVSRPVPELLHVYSVADGNVTVDSSGICTGTFTKTEDTEINPEHTYYTDYAFDLWVYDCDTAAGIDNNGALVFPYGKEDTDYRTEGDPLSGYAFNGAGSIFWRRLRTTFAEGIRSIMTTADRACFNSQDLIDEFDNFQSCYPEEIWRLDIERKYLRTFTGKEVDNSVTTGKQNPRFLTSMMQGRKKYQRRQWIRDQGVYFNSKYRLPDILDNSNTNEFNCTTPASTSDIAVQPSYFLELTPYQDMYLNVQVGNGNFKNTYITDGEPTLRAKAGRKYTFDLTGNYQETRIYINGANHLSAIGNLAPMYPYSFDLRALDHIKTLDIGTEETGYVNTKFTELVLPTVDANGNSKVPLLETLNIKNCHSIGSTINLKYANNIRKIEAEGTSITGITLPEYPNIEILHLPTTVTDISLYGARKLIDFYVKNPSTDQIDYSRLTKLSVYDSDYSAEWQTNKEYSVGDSVLINGDFYNCTQDHTSVSAAVRNNNEAWNTYLASNWEVSNENITLPVDWMAIAAAMLNGADKIFLEKLYCAKIGDIQDLAPIKARKQAIETTYDKIKLGGTIRVLGDYSLVEQEEYEETWEPDLTLDVSQATYTPKHKVTYKYDGVNGAEIMSMYVNTSDPIIDIWEYTDEDTQEKVHILNEMPHRDPTVSKTYQFGLRESGVYIPFSGWKLEGSSTPISQLSDVPIVENSDIVVETYFKEEDRTYPIKWYLEKNTNGTPKESTLIKTSGNPVPYGGGYDEEAPTVKQIHDAGFSTASMSISGGIATYSIFNGWEKLPTNINPSATDNAFVIYANWDSGSIDLQELFADTTTFSPVQLLALSMMSTSERTYAGVGSKVAPSKQFSYTMGYDSIKEGTELVGPNATRKILRLGLATSTPYVTNIQPMTEENGFTLAIDYCFTEDATYADNYNDATLASCYYISQDLNTINGFALYDHLKTLSQSDTTGPKVGFGDMFNRTDKSVAVGSSYTKGQRNMIVLRHPAGSDKLYIYSGMNGTLSLADNVVAQNITWNDSTSNAQLVLGRITNSSEQQYSNIKNAVANGKGTIYWAKYWPEDLGAGECKRIASWPHEEITYAFATYEDRVTGNNRTGVNPPNPALELVTFTTSSHGKIVQAQAATYDGAITGWGTSVARTVYNNRVFQGLPTELQAIVCKPEKYYKNFKVVYGSQGDNSYALESVTSSTRDYVYAPSANNLAANTSAYTAEELNTNLKPYMWLNDDTRVVVYNYDPNDTEHNYWPSQNESDRGHYLNLRFNNKPVTGTSANPLRIFKETTTSIASSTNIYTVVNNIPGGIKSGDVFIKSNGTAYLYVTNDDINNKGIQVVDRTGLYATNDNGGWLPASEYWTRSMGYGSSKVKFVYVDKAGHLELNDTKSASESGLNINYALSI